MIQKEKHFNRMRKPFFGGKGGSSSNFYKKKFQFLGKTYFFFGLYSILALELRNLD